MSSVAKKFNVIQQKKTSFFYPTAQCLCKCLAISGLVLFITYIALYSHHHGHPSLLFTISNQKWIPNNYPNTNSPTNINHLVFGIAGASQSYAKKKAYIESWWSPNVTRGYLFLDRPPIEHLPWPSTSPPFRISEDNSKYKDYPYQKQRVPFYIRVLRVIEETFKAGNEGVRWYVMGDDDTIFFVDNLVEVLSRYDHSKYFYIGTNSECIVSNFDYSYDMAFGGAGYALSYPLAEAVTNNMDLCIKRYPNLWGSDSIMYACIADLGVALTHEKGFHQVDLRRDMSGFLSTHPQFPLISLHHFDYIEPIFPSMNRQQSLNHLMKAAKADMSRILQQSICYHKQKNWTFTISWGYSAHIYEKHFPPSFLTRTLETFVAWKKGANPAFMFDTRYLSDHDPCHSPHVFFFDSVEEIKDSHFLTSYVRRSPRLLPACSNHSAAAIAKIHVISPIKRLGGVGSRRECCNVVQLLRMNAMAVKLRSCMRNEIVA